MKALLLTLLATAALAPSPALAQNILYVGDSHSYIAARSAAPAARRLGHVLLEGWAKAGHAVDYYAACGQRPATWKTGGNTPCGYTRVQGKEFEAAKSAAFPRFSRIFDPRSHERVVINLGDNMFSWSRDGEHLVSSFDEARFKAEMRSFLAELPSATPESCVWVGPTYHVAGKPYKKTNAAVDALYMALKKAVEGKCRLVDSRALVVPTAPNDGLHHVASDSAAWGLGILEATP